jgi:hypothetical protein
MPGQVPSFVNESLWQTPQASTLMRTNPAPGSGISRSTISIGPFILAICATRIFGMVPPINVGAPLGSKGCLLCLAGMG